MQIKKNLKNNQTFPLRNFDKFIDEVKKIGTIYENPEYLKY